MDEESTYSISEYMGHDGKQFYTTKSYCKIPKDLNPKCCFD